MKLKNILKGLVLASFLGYTNAESCTTVKSGNGKINHCKYSEDDGMGEYDFYVNCNGEINISDLKTILSDNNYQNLEIQYDTDNSYYPSIDDALKSINKSTKKLQLGGIEFKNDSLKTLMKAIPNLEALTLSYADTADDVDYTLLNNLKKLTQLEIIDTIVFPSDVKEISKITNLDYLILSKLNKIDFSPLSNMKSLTKLELSDMELKDYPSVIFSLPNLKYLSLWGNKLKKFSEKLSTIKNLEYLDLSSNDIDDKIPESLNSLAHLEKIDFSYNENLTGRVLTNKNLKYCEYYNPGGSGSSTVEHLCVPKDIDIPCLHEPITYRYDYHCGSEGYPEDGDERCYNWLYQHFETCSSSDNTTKIVTSTKVSYPTSTNGKCGGKDGRCPSGQCCSKYGYCGTSEKYCGTGCQSEFGKCNTKSTTTTKKITTTKKTSTKKTSTSKKTTTTKKTSTKKTSTNKKTTATKKTSTKKTSTNKKTTTTKKTSTKKSFPTSTNGKCSSKDGRCPSGQCCSKYGYCGTSEKYCGTGCQSEFGKCH